MKTTLLLCMIALLTGCPTDQSSPKPAAVGKVVGQGMDSPIIVSDSSTHVHYRLFHIRTDNGVPHVFISDTNYSAVTLQCVTNVTGCPLSGGLPQPVRLVYPWKIDILDADGEGYSIDVVTLKPTDNTNNTIVANFHRNPIDPEPDATTAGYTDIGLGNLPFQTASFVNNGLSPITLRCTAPGNCKLQIDYCLNGACS